MVLILQDQALLAELRRLPQMHHSQGRGVQAVSTGNNFPYFFYRNYISRLTKLMRVRSSFSLPNDRNKLHGTI